MTIPPGISSGRKLRIRGKGLGSGTRKGDQLVRVMIQSPKILTDEERALWQKLAGLAGASDGEAGEAGEASEAAGG
jgi:curved DNA-binding protein